VEDNWASAGLGGGPSGDMTIAGKRNLQVENPLLLYC
jgi:hypothetical protein